MSGAARFLSGEKAWARIREGAKKGPALVAVAWWGSDMSRLLPLKRGSVLVVRADQATMEQGQTNPWELEKLVKRGVRVFPLKNLHAKIFAFAKWAVVGSMNASRNSWEGWLLEAALEVSGRAVVGAVRNQVLSWALDTALDLDDIEELKEHYKPPARGRGPNKEGTASPKARRQIVDLPVLKILRTHRTYWEDHTQERFRKDSPALKKEAARRGENIDGIEWARAGVPTVDSHTRILEITTERDGRAWLTPPARLRLVTGTKRGKPEKIIYLARTAGLKRRRLSAAAKALGRNTRLVRLLRAKGKVLKDPDDLVRIFGLWGVRA